MWTQHFYKILLLLPTFLSLSTCDPCTPEFLPNLKDVVQLKYNERTGAVTKMILKLTDNHPFIEMFTQTCREVSNLRVDYREVGSGNWRKHTGRRNRIQLNKKVLDIKKIDPCAKYEVKIVAIVEDGVETDSEILNFGPFYKELDEDTIKEKLVGEDSMPDISDSISYSNVSSSGFTVSWGKICAQSINFYLLSGPDFAYDHTPYQMMSNILENDVENSLWVSTEPCHQYRIAIESFMTKEPIPEEDNDGRFKDHTAMEDVITDPITDTLIVTSMEEDSYLLTWQFTPPTDCVSIISYEILLIPETGEDDHPLMQGDWMDQYTELELSGSTYTACSNYQLQMKISFTTTAGNSGEKIVFQKEFRTNQVGQFAPEGSNDLAILEDSVAVTFGTCDKEVSVVLEDINENPIGEEFVVTPDSPNIELEPVLLHTDRQYNYYKVPVQLGLWLTSANVLNTCAIHGMTPQCWSSAHYDDNCVLSPGTYPAGVMAAILCNGGFIYGCKHLVNVFWYMPASFHQGSAFGNEASNSDVYGKDVMSTSGVQRYTICVRPIY